MKLRRQSVSKQSYKLVKKSRASIDQSDLNFSNRDPEANCDVEMDTFTQNSPEKFIIEKSIERLILDSKKPRKKIVKAYKEYTSSVNVCNQLEGDDHGNCYRYDDRTNTLPNYQNKDKDNIIEESLSIYGKCIDQDNFQDEIDSKIDSSEATSPEKISPRKKELSKTKSLMDAAINPEPTKEKTELHETHIRYLSAQPQPTSRQKQTDQRNFNSANILKNRNNSTEKSQYVPNEENSTDCRANLEKENSCPPFTMKSSLDHERCYSEIKLPKINLDRQSLKSGYTPECTADPSQIFEYTPSYKISLEKKNYGLICSKESKGKIANMTELLNKRVLQENMIEDLLYEEVGDFDANDVQNLYRQQFKNYLNSRQRDIHFHPPLKSFGGYSQRNVDDYELLHQHIRKNGEESQSIYNKILVVQGLPKER